MGKHQHAKINIDTKDSSHRPISARRYHFPFAISELATAISTPVNDKVLQCYSHTLSIQTPHLPISSA